jgi:hypothetical protein
MVAAASAGAVAAEPAEDDILASGINYQPATLRAEDERLEAGGKPARKSEASEPALETGNDDNGLFRLQVRAALRACLEAISAANGSGPIAVQSVDYARYLSNPALIVRFAAANGRFVWVSGPDCGTPPGAADTRARVQVGS